MSALDIGKRISIGADVEKAEFGERLRQLREAAGVSQTALAEKLGLPQTSISQWERGAHAPPVTAAPELAKALGVPILELFKAAKPAKHKPKK